MEMSGMITCFQVCRTESEFNAVNMINISNIVNIIILLIIINITFMTNIIKLSN